MHIQGIGDPERLSHSPRARRQILLTAPSGGHDAQALDRIDGPQEHCTGVTYRSCNHVQATMEAIAEVYVGGSRGPEH